MWRFGLKVKNLVIIGAGQQKKKTMKIPNKNEMRTL